MEEKKSPISRHDALQPLSREHHFGLLLCWKIRTGFQKGVSAARIKTYCDWFYEKYLTPHFEIEEQYLFPIMGEANELVSRAISDHRRIAELVHQRTDLEEALRQIEKTLNDHIRFEERVLFNEIQRVATADQLELIRRVHSHELREESYDDEFWV